MSVSSSYLQRSPTRANALKTSPISSSRTRTLQTPSTNSNLSRRVVERRNPAFYAVLIEKIGQDTIDAKWTNDDWSVISTTLNSSWGNLIDYLVKDDYESLLSLQGTLIEFYNTERSFIRLLYPWVAGLVGIELFNEDVSHLTRAAIGEVIGFVHSAASAEWVARKVEEPEELVSILSFRGPYESAGIALVLYDINGYEYDALNTIASLDNDELRTNTLIIVSQFGENKLNVLADWLVESDNGEITELLLQNSKVTQVGRLIDAVTTKLNQRLIWTADELAIVDVLRSVAYYKLSALSNSPNNPVRMLEDKIAENNL